MVSLENITVRFTDKTLFERINFLINKTDRIGLAGKNGAGKSTLLKILTNTFACDEGRVHYPKGLSMAYLAQEMEHDLDETVRGEASKAFQALQNIEDRIEEITQLLQERTDYESDEYSNLVQELSDLNENIHTSGLNKSQGQVEQVLMGLGFNANELDKKLGEFSGGWRMRVELAKVLLQEPDLLLLDEPTNHLDIESIIWLENFLKTYSGALVLISHDQRFLDEVTNRTIELNKGRAIDYKMSYSKYKEQRLLDLEQIKREALQQEKEIKHTEQLIEKFRYKASKASFAQGLIKKLERMEKVTYEADELALMHIKFPPAIRSGKVVVEAHNLSKSFEDKHVLKPIDFTIARGEKIAILGKNGAGKSTFLNIIAKNLMASEGTFELGHNVNLGFFAQNQSEKLDGNLTVLETVESIARDEEVRKNIRSILGAFLFSGESVDKKVKVLSGGEKGRLALCKLMLDKYNLLVMDEPTNHLDIPSKEMLKKALLDYDGTLIIVSHDRSFLQGLTDKLYVLEDGRLRVIYDDIETYYKNKLNEKANAAIDLKEERVQHEAVAQKTIQKVEEKKVVNEEKKVLTHEEQKELRSLKNRFDRTEQKIAELEGQIAEWEKMMLTVDFSDTELVQKEQTKKSEMDLQLEQMMEEWEDLDMRIQELEA